MRKRRKNLRGRTGGDDGGGGSGGSNGVEIGGGWLVGTIGGVAARVELPGVEGGEVTTTGWI